MVLLMLSDPGHLFATVLLDHEDRLLRGPSPFDQLPQLDCAGLRLSPNLRLCCLCPRSWALNLPMIDLLVQLKLRCGLGSWRVIFQDRDKVADLLIKEVDGYVIGQKLGSGASGQVYLARSMVNGGPPAALKVIDGVPKDVGERFFHEVQVAAQNLGPGVVKFKSWGRLPAPDGRCYLLLEYVEGTTLEEWIRLPNRPINMCLKIAAMIAHQVADSLHRKGVIHRDLKPANLMLTQTEPSDIKIIDLGIARLLDAHSLGHNTSHDRSGTPAYMAPEIHAQSRAGDYDFRADVFSLGVILYELLTGDVPADDARDFAQARVIPLPSSKRSGVPSVVDKLVAVALDPDPNQRYSKNPAEAMWAFRDRIYQVLKRLEETPLPKPREVLPQSAAMHATESPGDPALPASGSSSPPDVVPQPQPPYLSTTSSSRHRRWILIPAIGIPVTFLVILALVFALSGHTIDDRHFVEDLPVLVDGGLTVRDMRPDTGDLVPPTSRDLVPPLSWQRLVSPGDIPSGVEIKCVWGRDSKDLYLAGWNPKFTANRARVGVPSPAAGILLHSSDGGTSWQPLRKDLQLFSVWGSSRSLVIAVGSDGAILRTGDAGRTWSRQASPTTAILTSVWGSGEQDIYAVGDNEHTTTHGVFLHSADGGMTWTLLDRSVTGNALRSVWGSGAKDVWAVGAGGTIARSTAGLRGFSELPRPDFIRDTTAFDLSAVWGSSATDVYVVGKSGLVLHTVDHGKTWRRVPTGRKERLHAIWGSGAKDVYVAGEFGALLHSTNTLGNWELLTPDGSPTVDKINSIWGFGHGTYYVAGNPPLLLHTPH